MLDQSYLFVTDSGNVHIARPAAKGPRTIEPVWVDKAHPVVALITDAATQKTYAFTRAADAKPGAKDVYFELAEKPAERPYTPVPKADASDPTYPLNALLPFARVLTADGVVKDK
jgi:hypothetical protein